MSANTSYRACLILKELIKLNPEEKLTTQISVREFKQLVIFNLDISSITTLNAYTFYLEGSKIIRKVGDNVYLVDKEKAKKFIKKNDPFNNNKRTKDKKLKGVNK